MYPESWFFRHHSLPHLASIAIASPFRYTFIACQKIKDVYEYAE